MREIISIFIISVFALSGYAQYSGKVFVDENDNGIYDSGEKLLKGIKVSDGLNVVETESDGKFVLPGHEKERFIFITVPSGYKAVYNHYRKIDDSTVSYDFGIVPYTVGIDNKGSHRFIQITDTEISQVQGNENWAENLHRYSVNEKVAFIVHTGDICYENGLKSHIKLVNTRNMDVPVYYCIGNHDLVKGKYGEELFENIYGPVYYSFDVDNVHYIVTPMAGGDYWPGYTKDDVCRWMKNDLEHVKPGTPVYVFNHDILTEGDKFIYSGKSESINLNEYNLKAWIYGHWHINHIKKQGDVYTVCSSTIDKGGIDHSTSSYRVMRVDRKGDFVSEMRYAYIDNQLCISSPSGKTASNTINVNVYSSNASTEQVTYTCMYGEKVIIKDRKLNPKTDWTWGAELSLDSKYYDKELKLLVTAEFSNGEKRVEEKKFEYSPGEVLVELGGNWTNLLANSEHIGGIISCPLDSLLNLAWSTNVGGNIFMTSPIVYNGMVYIASVDDDNRGRAAIYALEAKTGKIVWKHHVEGSIKNTIAIDKDKVFAQDIYGIIYAIDCNNGSLCWKKDIGMGVLPSLTEGLATKDGILYAGTGKYLQAIDASTGEMLWQNRDWGQNQGSTATLSVSDEVIIGSTQWGALYGNDVKTGKMLWSKSQDGLGFRASSPAIKDGLLYLISDKAFFIMDAKKGDIIVRKDLPYSVDATSTPVISENEIIFGTSRDGLVALDRSTLNEKWHCPVGKALIYTSSYTRPDSQTIETSPIIVENTVFVGASDGYLYAVDKNKGSITAKYDLGAPIFSSVSFSGNTLFVSDFGGNVYAFCMKSK